jgi:hypothetical protein
MHAVYAILWCMRSKAARQATLPAGGLLKKTIYLDPEEWDELRRKSYEESRPISEIIRELIRAGLGLDAGERE